MNRPAPRELIASIDGRSVGSLREEGDLWSFEYDPAWAGATDAFDLAPNLPRKAGKVIDGATTRPVQWFFDNLLPEEGARELLASEARIPSADAFGLLAYYGKESAGAITLSLTDEARPESGLRPLTDEELHARIAQLPRRSLSADAPKRMSLAGAQHKLAIVIRDGKLFYPVGETPSTHILKPNHSQTEHYPHSVANEYFVMRLAARTGLAVPSVQIRFVPDPIYLIERFDRQIVEGEVRRLHVIDACQLLGLDRTFKYRQSQPETLAHCIELCHNRARSRQSLMTWALFNTLTGNSDAHLKNISFLVSADGIELAPFYDLLSTECYRAEIGNDPRWPDTPLSMQIGAARNFSAVTRDDFLQFATDLGATRRAAARLVDEFAASLAPAAAQVLEEFESLAVPNAAARAGQLRVLRSIQHTVIRDMLAPHRFGRPAATN